MDVRLDPLNVAPPDMTVHFTDCLGNGQLAGANQSRLAAKFTAAQLANIGVKVRRTQRF